MNRKLSPFLGKTQAFLAGVGLAAMVASSASAHDFFILPSAFTTAPHQSLPVDVTIASKFPEPEIAVAAERIAELQVSGTPQAVFKADGPGPKSMKAHFMGHAPGLAVLSARAVTREVEYPEARIHGLLEEYQVSPEAAKAVEAMPKPRVLKAFSTRFAKAFVCVERCDGGSDPTQALGHRLEFVAAKGSAKTFVLLAGGAPLADYPAVVVGRDGVRHRVRTSAEGRLELPAGLVGPVMLFASTMQPPADAGGRFKLDLASLTLSGR
ncbi:DUF4198 domain-containing protein [Caulobacter mirabilis]|uniref:DUF4198 domain-containing protein n=1 Tax=Caulobacter mirabilis TaxID=69666 RepID=A0A2D2AUK0_9CAUL|nr:DUF4198 domain-containing protein [Caulobacter mirabilis]ATQ41686.1 hypothetical protein CSW64_04290 [Caulobacter mirabilis]